MTAVDTAPRPPDTELADDGARPGRTRRLLAAVETRIRRGSGSAPRRARPPLSPGVAGARWALLVLSGLALWVLFYAFVLSGIQEARTQSIYYATLREGLSQALTPPALVPPGGAIETGSPILLLDAPTAGLHKVVVVEGTSSSSLTSGPGHLSSTVLPGQQGVSVLMGRSVTFGAPFRSLTAMHAGDRITVTTGQGVFTFVVDRVRHPGDPLPPPVAANTSRLTLLTSAASGWRSGWAPAGTVYVDATMQGSQIQPGPAGRHPAAATEQPMAVDTGRLVVLVLWLQALLAVAVLTVWGRSRWGGLQTWLISVPLVLACLWGATQSAFVLLPNLI